MDSNLSCGSVVATGVRVGEIRTIHNLKSYFLADVFPMMDTPSYFRLSRSIELLTE